jgi:hypothetical protein
VILGSQTLGGAYTQWLEHLAPDRPRSVSLLGFEPAGNIFFLETAN